ncbi:DUF4349 domain-containing protein [Bacillus lacus]|uniref:DUF4349 domain-containing protein n=1 Tax=Metabacillus lacus TaxID=1983721 RepID=A0A7X2LZF0_9BACI|nr:DUF4349 domain-containing protein [Metabacillus lacus]MRX71629.1 DUF4349 domain-containing protein [Metabacillus lacus]
MKRSIAFLYILLLLLTACSQSEGDSSSVGEEKNFSSEDSIQNEEESGESSNNAAFANEHTRKIVYQASLQLEVDNYEASAATIEDETAKLNGYIVSAADYAREEEENRAGVIVVKIPQEHFQDFITSLSTAGNRVREKELQAQDVTEEFVDTEARIRSKKAVEARLLAFMEDAQKTEELLAISKDLSTVQEEIEQLTGRLNLLKNQVNYASITISLQEEGVKIPAVKQELNTWGKTKEQFMKSVNTVLQGISSTIVFFAGNSPIIVPAAAICFLFFFFRRKRNKEK